MEDMEMTVTLTLDDGDVECSIITIFECDGKDYIALLPKDEKGEPLDEVYIYGYKESEDEEPELIYIEDEEEYEAAADKFDEWLDLQEFGDIEDEE